MNRCIVIYGDPALGKPIADGIQRSVVQLDRGELAAVKAECARLNALNGVRAYGDGVRFETACRAMDMKYYTPKHGRLYNALWGLVGYVVLVAIGWYEYFEKWNRG
jgi:hypothetical protein